MYKNFIVCNENELKNVLNRENKNHKNTPEIYMAGFTKFCNWVYEYYTPDCDYSHERLYLIDYSGDGEGAVWDKFFNYMAIKTFNEIKFEKLIIDREEYNIDVYCNENEYYSLSAFWHSTKIA